MTRTVTALLTACALLASLAACKIGGSGEDRTVDDMRGKIVQRADVRARNHIILTIDPIRAGGDYTVTVPRGTTCDTGEWYPDCRDGE